MILNFIFSNLNTIIFFIWLILLGVVAARYFKPEWVKNISYNKLLFTTIGIHIVYNLFLTVALYYVWKLSDLTGTYTKLSYFLGYVFIHFWLYVVLLFLTSGILYLIFRIWKKYRGGFIEEGPILLFILMLISGWPGVLTSVFLGFIFAVLMFCFCYLKSYFKKIPMNEVVIESAFIFSTLIALFFTKFIFSLF